jgi:hypothetical protein
MDFFWGNMAIYKNLMMSFCFCLLNYVSAGYAYKSFFKVSRLTLAEGLLLGAGLITSATLFVSMLLPSSLRITSISLMSLGLILGIIAISGIRAIKIEMQSCVIL